MAIPVAEARETIHEHGAYVWLDSAVGRDLNQFKEAGLPILTPYGFEFLAQHSLDDHELHTLATNALGQPYWAFNKCYSNVLPRDYTFSFHAGPTFRSLVFQLWSPCSTVVLRERSHLHPIKEEDIDMEISQEWGLIAVHDSRLENLDMPKRKITLEQGGIIITDSRQRFTVIEGFVICVGHVSEETSRGMTKISLPHSREFSKTIEQLEGRGYKINYEWE
ncbi:hypothetical protein B0J15DRAFT_486986 [Fusarium solani]|uniref:Uncharacterized protein n=1 Tax=Fusarium solani TaxID=169388 RepID=A0A9P9KUK6_FUSSL|nr:uncharacterized protein B0J15DRAFT_486986 [Fusarium solani]KAH7268744.1 hypothetical protein B0J15DRAFT_486986 [Fusarium solani]